MRRMLLAWWALLSVAFFEPAARAQPPAGPMPADAVELDPEDERDAREPSAADVGRVTDRQTPTPATPAGASSAGGASTACRVREDVAESCGVLACVQFDAQTSERRETTIADKGKPGVCGLCETNVECDGAACLDGYCSVWKDPAPPEPFYPDFYLVTLDATVNATGDSKPKLLPGLGFTYQGAFRRVAPARLGEHGWMVSDVPDYYFNAGGSVALALSGTQQLLAELGITRRVGWSPLSTLGVSALYQRRGGEVWDFGSGAANVDRVGAAVSVGFLYNAFLRLSYAARVRGNEDAGGSVLVSVVYMRDLVDELLPDRFKSLIPEKFR